MKSYFKTLAIVLLINQLALACASCGCRARKAKTDKGAICGSACKVQQNARACDVAPVFTLTNYDGTTVNLADLKGKIVVIEFFNYKCPFSIYHYQTEPTMRNLVKKYAEKNVQFLAINSTSWQKTEENKAFAEKNKVTYPILDDRTGKVGKAFGATRTPHMYIINEKGKIVYRGAIDNAPLGKLPEGHDKVLNFVDIALAEITEGKPITIQKTREYGCTVKYADK